MGGIANSVDDEEDSPTSHVMSVEIDGTGGSSHTIATATIVSPENSQRNASMNDAMVILRSVEAIGYNRRRLSSRAGRHKKRISERVSNLLSDIVEQNESHMNNFTTAETTGLIAQTVPDQLSLRDLRGVSHKLCCQIV